MFFQLFCGVFFVDVYMLINHLLKKTFFLSIWLFYYLVIIVTEAICIKFGEDVYNYILGATGYLVILE